MTAALREPKTAARSRSDELMWPIMNTKNVSNAERDGDENEENRIATAVIITNSRNIRKIALQIEITIDPPT